MAHSWLGAVMQHNHKIDKEFAKANKIADSAISSKRGFVIASDYLDRAIGRMKKRGREDFAKSLSEKKKQIDEEMEKRGLLSPHNLTF